MFLYHYNNVSFIRLDMKNYVKKMLLDQKKLTQVQAKYTLNINYTFKYILI